MELTNKEFWNKGYTDRQIGILPHPRLLFDFELMKILEEYLPSKKGFNLIEMGCGGSKWLPYFYRKFGYNVFGIDYSEAGVEKAKQNLKILNCNGKIWCLDFLRDLPASLYNSFDILISLGVVEHFTHPERILEIFAKLLRNGGIIVTICPNKIGLPGYMHKAFSRETYNLHKIFNLDTLKLWHIRANFKIIHSSYLYLSDLSKFFPIEHRLPTGLLSLYSKINYLINVFYILFYKLVKNINNCFPFLCSMMIVIGRKKE